MPRQVFVPPELTEGLASLFSLKPQALEKLDKILVQEAGRSVLDTYLALVNDLQVTDKVAGELLDACRYVQYLRHERKGEFTAVLEELANLLSAAESVRGPDAAANLGKNMKAFSAFFSEDSGFSLLAKKRYLESRQYNSVIDIHSICDLRPVLNEARSKILSQIVTTTLEFTVTDSTGGTEVVPLNLDVAALKKLRQELDQIAAKHSLIAAQYQSRTKS